MPRLSQKLKRFREGLGHTYMAVASLTRWQYQEFRKNIGPPLFYQGIKARHVYGPFNHMCICGRGYYAADSRNYCNICVFGKKTKKLIEYKKPKNGIMSELNH